jgi:asparagine synthase (glutamine-hydrolysing)
MARQFFGRNIEAHGVPGFAHDTRWQTTGALMRLLSGDMQASTAGRDVIGDLIGSLHADFMHWGSLAQDQHIEIRTLLSGYLLSSQGDRMLLGNSVEGRFPFLDNDVIALADSLPASYKLRVLDEKHVLKRVAENVVPHEIIARKKQPYRAPDALSFVARNAPAYIDEALSESAVRDANVFDPHAVSQLLRKCRARGSDGQFSNTDNMALVGVLSTQLLHRQFIAVCPGGNSAIKVLTDVDKSSNATRC